MTSNRLKIIGLLAKESVEAAAAEVELDAYDRKALKSYLTADGWLKDFPAQQKKGDWHKPLDRHGGFCYYKT